MAAGAGKMFFCGGRQQHGCAIQQTLCNVSITTTVINITRILLLSLAVWARYLALKPLSVTAVELNPQTFPETPLALAWNQHSASLQEPNRSSLEKITPF